MCACRGQRSPLMTAGWRTGTRGAATWFHNPVLNQNSVCARVCMRMRVFLEGVYFNSYRPSVRVCVCVCVNIGVCTGGYSFKVKSPSVSVFALKL